MAQRIIAVDFDGTLAEYHGFKGIGKYGPPVQSMVDRIHRWLYEGHDVWIHTARVAHDPYIGIDGSARAVAAERLGIQQWIKDAGLPNLKITATKYRHFTEFWDDRCVSVEKNTGKFITMLPISEAV